MVSFKFNFKLENVVSLGRFFTGKTKVKGYLHENCTEAFRLSMFTLWAPPNAEHQHL